MLNLEIVKHNIQVPNSIANATPSSNKMFSKNRIIFKGNESQSDSFEKKHKSYQIELAKKYMYVADSYSLIYDEIWTLYSWAYRNFRTDKTIKAVAEEADKVRALINKYRDSNESLTKKIESLNNDIKLKKQAEETENKIQQRINEQLKVENTLKQIQEMKLEKTLISAKRKNKIFSTLDNKYIAIENISQKDKKNVTYPDGIMVIGTNSNAEIQNTLDYLNKNNCNLQYINFANTDIDTAIEWLSTTTKKNKLEDKHFIIYIANFNKYTVNNDENDSFINKLKGCICHSASKFNTTFLVFENHPEDLDENIIQNHRFQVKIDISDIKFKPKDIFLPIKDGYTLRYDAEDSAQVNLYLGDSGLNDKILWIDSRNADKIENVEKRLSNIKQIERFKNINCIQIPKPNSLYNLNDYYPLPYRYTENGIQIYQKLVKN